MAIKTLYMEILPDRDTANSYPPPIQVNIQNGSTVFVLYGQGSPPRELTISNDDLRELVRNLKD